jgi:methionyl-tRNA formyltransferase
VGNSAPGHVQDGLTVTCGQGALTIVQAQREGRRAMSGQEILRGFTPPDRMD